LFLFLDIKGEYICGMLVATIPWMQNKGIDRKIKFNCKKFKSTFLISSVLFSIFGCSIESTSSTHSSSNDDETNLSNKRKEKRMIIKRGLITLIILIISISITSATNCYGIDPVTLLDNGLVVHYSMDSADKSGNIMKDLSGNNRDGQIYNDATTDPDSVFGESIFFDGDDHQGGFIEVLNSEGIHPDQFTLSIWFKTGDNYTVVEDDLDGWDFLFGNTIQGVGWRYGYGIYFLKSENELRFFVSHFEHSYVSTHFDWDNDKGWHHVVGSYDGQVIKMYLDGLLADTFSFSGPVEKTTDSIRVGANYYWNGDRWFFDGLVDDARMYDRALSESEVAALYNWDVNITTGPEITSPTPNSVLTDTTVTFAWTAGTTPVTAWLLDVGSSAGSQDILDSGSLGTSTSVPVSGLPCDGSTVYVRLWYEAGGWQYLDYQYTASSSCTATDPDIITDSDGDSYTKMQGDCNDNDSSINPSALELCDGIDNNCDGDIDEGFSDSDGDGYLGCNDDCDDTDPDIFPGNEELCDEKDNDCNGMIDDSEILCSNGDNSPPSIPQLIVPLDGQLNLETTFEFAWEKCSDGDGDSLTYNLYVCEDTEFIDGCITKENIASIEMNSNYYAGLGLIVLIFGFTFFGNRSNSLWIRRY